MARPWYKKKSRGRVNFLKPKLASAALVKENSLKGVSPREF